MWGWWRGSSKRILWLIGNLISSGAEARIWGSLYKKVISQLSQHSPPHPPPLCPTASEVNIAISAISVKFGNARPVALGATLKRWGASGAFSIEKAVVERGFTSTQLSAGFGFWRWLLGRRAARRGILPEVAVPKDPLDHHVFLDEANDLHNPPAHFGWAQCIASGTSGGQLQKPP